MHASDPPLVSYQKRIALAWSGTTSMQERLKFSAWLIKECADKVYRYGYVEKRRTYADTRKELRQALALAETVMHHAQSDVRRASLAERPNVRARMHLREKQYRECVRAYKKHLRREKAACHKHALIMVAHARKTLEDDVHYHKALAWHAAQGG